MCICRPIARRRTSWFSYSCLARKSSWFYACLSTWFDPSSLGRSDGRTTERAKNRRRHSLGQNIAFTAFQKIDFFFFFLNYFNSTFDALDRAFCILVIIRKIILHVFLVSVEKWTICVCFRCQKLSCLDISYCDDLVNSAMWLSYANISSLSLAKCATLHDSSVQVNYGIAK